jgi:tRNA threonylcarbamoyl adenosine modification protein YeaZ
METQKQAPTAITLAIESGIGSGSLAILEADRLLGHLDDAETPARAEKLLSEIDKLVSGCLDDISKINRIAVSTGPGSFTGLRIGIAAALGLSRSLAVELVGVPLLEAIAANTNIDGKILIALPIGKNDLSFAIYEKAGSSLECKNEPKAVRIGIFINNLEEFGAEFILLPQSLYKRFSDDFGLMQGEVGFSNKVQFRNIGSNLASIVGIHSRLVPPSPRSLEPLYLSRNSSL